jgi:hypothetical protein
MRASFQDSIVLDPKKNATTYSAPISYSSNKQQESKSRNGRLTQPQRWTTLKSDTSKQRTNINSLDNCNTKQSSITCSKDHKCRLDTLPFLRNGSIAKSEPARCVKISQRIEYACQKKLEELVKNSDNHKDHLTELSTRIEHLEKLKKNPPEIEDCLSRLDTQNHEICSVRVYQNATYTRIAELEKMVKEGQVAKFVQKTVTSRVQKLESQIKSIQWQISAHGMTGGNLAYLETKIKNTEGIIGHTQERVQAMFDLYLKAREDPKILKMLVSDVERRSTLNLQTIRNKYNSERVSIFLSQNQHLEKMIEEQNSRIDSIIGEKVQKNQIKLKRRKSTSSEQWNFDEEIWDEEKRDDAA